MKDTELLSTHVMARKNFQLLFILLLFSPILRTYAGTEKPDSTQNSNPYQFKYQSLIIPAVLIGYGVIGNDNGALEIVNANVKEEVDEHIDERLTIDDISQHIPALSVYALNAFGVKGQHNFKDRTIILATAYLIMAGTVSTLKYTTKIVRPDQSSNNSFPSGHTATAFVGAEFLWHEYKDVSPWYGIMGYAIATGTGVFRIVNDRHWVTDVATGAGIGMLSTKVAYWLYPWMNSKLFKKNNSDKKSSILLPYYNGHQTGLIWALKF